MSSQVPLFSLCINYVLDTIPNIIDLSGQTSFTLSIDITRPRGHARQHPEAHSSFIDVVINGSVLDVSSALQTGHLPLVESEGDDPKTKWRDCVRRNLPKDIFHKQSRPDLNLPKLVRINPGQLAQPTDPQCVVCSLNPAIISVFKDQNLYQFKYPPAPPDGQEWDGGISWWKPCSDSSRPPDISAPTDQPHAKVRMTTLPIFKAMANPPRPPHIDYKLEIVPSVLSLEKTQAIKLSLKVCLREEIQYSVQARRFNASGGTALVESNIKEGILMYST
jgi:hypothetical protein